MKEQGDVVNRSKERRETKWGTSHGHGLEFFSIKIKRKCAFPASVSGLVGLSHS